MSEMITDRTLIFEARKLRDAAAKLYYSDAPKINKLVGGKNLDGSSFEDTWVNRQGEAATVGITPETLGLLRALNGPHGFAVYKMLLLKKNSLQEI